MSDVVRLTALPEVAGVLSAADVAETAASIAAMQEPDGAVPWTTGAHVDVWNHVEAAMALLVGGQVEAAERAYDWCVRTQRADGSWPMKVVGGEVEDASGETNMCAYLAVGIWHHWLLRHDLDVVRRCWPAVRRGLDFVVGMQQDWGGIAWSQEWTSTGVDGEPAAVDADALLAGSSSIHQSLRAGVALADLLGDPQPAWELAGGRLGHAVRAHLDRFLDKRQFSMDWYYPVLGGAVRGRAGLAMIDARWDEFVSDGVGARCVSTNPWFTGAETCELVMALDALGEHDRAVRLFADMQHLRHDGGRYWTGLVLPDRVHWPHEQTTYTAAAVVLAADALGQTRGHGTAGSGIMRGETLAAPFAEIDLRCGCPETGTAPSGTEPSADGIARVS